VVVQRAVAQGDRHGPAVAGETKPGDRRVLPAADDLLDRDQDHRNALDDRALTNGASGENASALPSDVLDADEFGMPHYRRDLGGWWGFTILRSILRDSCS